MSRRGAAGAVAALPVLAGDGAAAGPVRGPARAEPSPALRRFAAAVRGWRPIAGRLCVTSSGPLEFGLARALALSCAADDIVGAVEAGRTAMAVHDLALVRVFEGRLDDAAGLLNEAAAGADPPGCAWADLAAVRLGRARDDVQQVLVGFDAALRARNDAAGRFNRALARTMLSLPSARGEWERALLGEPDGGWQEEIRAWRDASEGGTADGSLERAAWLDAIGRPREAWRERIAALRARRPSLAAVLSACARALLEDDLPAPAAAFAEDLALAVAGSGDAALTAAAHRVRARALSRLGCQAAARRAVADARGERADAALQAAADLVQGEMELAGGRPAEALRLASRACRQAGEREAAIVLRGRALLAAGRHRHALTVLERDAREAPSPAVALLSALASDGARRGLAWAEAARDAGRLDAIDSIEDELRALEARMPPGGALVEFALVGDTAVAWVLGADGVKRVGLAAPAPAIRSAVQGLADSRPRRGNPAHTWLRHELWEPLVRRLPPGGRLAIVPHDVLAHVPWASFAAGRWAVSLAPGARRVHAALDRQAVPAGRSVLLIGAPSFDRRAFPWLAGGAAARAEVRRLCALHPGARTLLGDAATADAIREALPEAGVVHYAGPVIAAGGDPVLPLPGAALRALDLRAVRLVVLSSAPHPDVRRDDLGALARALLDAGAGAVVCGGRASLLHHHLRRAPDAAAAAARHGRAVWSDALPAPPRP